MPIKGKIRNILCLNGGILIEELTAGNRSLLHLARRRGIQWDVRLVKPSWDILIRSTCWCALGDNQIALCDEMSKSILILEYHI